MLRYFRSLIVSFTLSLNKNKMLFHNIFTQVTLLCCLILGGCKVSQGVRGSQSNDATETTYRYQSHLNAGETVIKEDYNVILTQTGLGDVIYRQIYPEIDFMTKYIEFNDPQHLVISGRYIEWYDNGNLKTKGQCYDDLKEGEWIEYHPTTGSKKAVGTYLQDVRAGDWKYYNTQGVHTETYTYVNGKRQEEYLSIDAYGNETKHIGFPANTQTLPYLTKYDRLETAQARDKATFKSIQSRVIGNLIYPAHLRDLRVQGITETLITIDSDGNVKDIAVLSGICQAFAEESMRIAKLLDRWSPGTCDGLPCESEYLLYISFSTE